MLADHSDLTCHGWEAVRMQTKLSSLAARTAQAKEMKPAPTSALALA
jgi:hypothetical protein